jgi:hypothetical protein
VAITGTKGRIEMDIQENVTHLLSDDEEHDVAASKGAFKGVRMRVFPMFGQGYEIDAPTGDGGHGGADPVMLEQLFSPTPPPDPFRRAATHLDGAASVLVGISANQAIRTGQPVNIDQLFPLPRK